MDPGKSVGDQRDKKSGKKDTKGAARPRQNDATVIWAVAYWPFIGFVWSLWHFFGTADLSLPTVFCAAAIGYIVGLVAINQIYYRLPPSE